MSNTIDLNAAKRDAAGTQAVKKLRRQGVVPGVIYGSKQDNYSVQVDSKEITDMLNASASQNVLVNLMIDGAKEASKLAIIQAVQLHPISGAIQHIDFHAVSENEQISASVPLVLEGEPLGVSQGGLLDQQLHSLDVRCLPKDLPASLIAQIAEVELGQAVHIKDVNWPEGVEAVLNEDVVVALVTETRASKSEGEDEDGAPLATEGAAEEGAEASSETAS